MKIIEGICQDYDISKRFYIQLNNYKPVIVTTSDDQDDICYGNIWFIGESDDIKPTFVMAVINYKNEIQSLALLVDNEELFIA